MKNNRTQKPSTQNNKTVDRVVVENVNSKIDVKPNKAILVFCCLVLTVIWGILANKTFNPRVDMNGDNVCYYIYATSLATGHGYCDLSVPGEPPTSNFPPGYPLLMTPLRMMTDSIIAQKCLNLSFVLIGILLVFFTLLKLGMRWDVSFVAAAAGLFSPRLWHFATMMMSEASFFLTSAFVFFALAHYLDAKKEDTPWWSDMKQPWLWAMIVVLIYNYHIRIQGLALVAGVCFLLLLQKRWVGLGTTIVSFIIGCLPYMLRNKLLGLTTNRYVDTIMASNSWRPDEGTLSIIELMGRFFQTLKMLIFNAIPNTIFPYLNVDCDNPQYSFGIYVLGIIVLAVILIGFWSMKPLRWGLIGYLIATLGVICLFSAPSGNRYITSCLPLLAAGLICGIWQIIEWGLAKHKNKLFTGCALVLCLLFIASKKSLHQEIVSSQQKYIPGVSQFLEIAKKMKKNAPKGTIVCSRKSQLFWLESGFSGVCYKFTKDTKELLIDLVDNKVDIVVLDGMGWSSNARYLLPAIQQNRQYFHIVMKYDNPYAYVFLFDRELASKELLSDVPENN